MVVREAATESAAAGQWQERAFQEVIDFREGPGILAKDFREEGIPLVRLAGLSNGVSVLQGCNFLDPDMVASRWSHFKLELGDILLSTSASLGRIAVVDEEGTGAVPYTGIIRMRPKGNSLYAPFIRYLLEGPDFQRQAEMVGSGSVIRHFGPMHLRQLTVRFPPLSQQRAIAHILGTLDDKIELNRRMSETLEEMARALFKSWFVDFDPVRAKAALRRHALHASEPDTAAASNTKGSQWTVERARAYLDAMDPQIVDLFPDRLVDSELGEIPERWEVRSLDDIADFTNGLALQRFPPDGDEWLPVIKIAEMRRGYTDKTGRASANLDARYVVEDGNLLFSWSGSLELIFWTHGRGALNQHLFKVTSDEFPQWFYWGCIREHLDEFRAIAAGKATTMGHIQRHHLTDAKAAVPPPNLIAPAKRQIGALVKQHVHYGIQSRALAAQRATLLPSLMSGKVSVHSD